MEDTAHAKVMGQHRAWGVGETVRRAVWLEQSEREGGRERGGHAGPCELWEKLGLSPQRRWEPLRATGRGVGLDSGTQGTLWWLWWEDRLVPGKGKSWVRGDQGRGQHWSRWAMLGVGPW